MRRGARTKDAEKGADGGEQGGEGGGSGRAGLAHVFASRLRIASMRKSRSVGPVPGLCGRERRHQRRKRPAPITLKGKGHNDIDINSEGAQ